MSSSINEPSIFISHVFPNKAGIVYETFAELFGESYIDDVDIVNHDFNGQEICRVYVHFKKWPTEPKFQRLRTRLLNGETVQIVYDEPWYWKCVASKLPRITSKGSMTTGPKKRIVLDDDKPTAKVTPTKPVPRPSTTTTATPTLNTTPPTTESSTWADKVKGQGDEDEKKSSTTTERVAETTQAEAVVVENTNTSTSTNTEETTSTSTPSTPSKTSVLEVSAMQALQYEYGCFVSGATLKTKEQFMQYLGGVIFPVVDKISPIFSSKITGMLLESEPRALVNALGDKSMFDTLIVRCYVTLQEAIVAEMSSLMTK
jgi:hypothetical protein